MGIGSDTTKAGRPALHRLAGALFARLRREYPGWGFGELRQHLKLPDTRLFRDLAEEAGFRLDGTLSPSEENAILRTLRRGIFGAENMARETKLPFAQVTDFLDEIGVPFGAGGWGMFPWPGGGERSVPERPPRLHPRKVSRKGQFSYRGRLYGLGMRYAGTVGWVEDRGAKLRVHFGGRRFTDRPTVTLYRIG